MEITKEIINEAFDNYVTSFKALAEQEDKLEEMKNGLEDYKEGSPKYQEAMREIREFERTLTTYQRAFRMTALELDRVKTLVNFMKQ
jgi:soluble cytochrome b562